MAGNSKGTKNSGAAKNTRTVNSDRVQQDRQTSLQSQIVVTVLAISAAILALIMLLTDMNGGWKGSATGFVGYYLCAIIYGLFGMGAYLIPLVFAYFAIFHRRNRKNHTQRAKRAAVCVVFCSLCMLFYLAFVVGKKGAPVFYDVVDMWKYSVAPHNKHGFITGGGVVGALLGGCLYMLLKKVAWVFVVLVFIGAMLIIVEVTPFGFFRMIANAFGRMIYGIKSAVANHRQNSEQRALEKARERESAEREKEAAKAAAPEHRIFPEGADERIPVKTRELSDSPFTETYQPPVTNYRKSKTDKNNKKDSNVQPVDGSMGLPENPYADSGSSANTHQSSYEETRELMDLLFSDTDSAAQKLPPKKEPERPSMDPENRAKLEALFTKSGVSEKLEKSETKVAEDSYEVDTQTGEVFDAESDPEVVEDIETTDTVETDSATALSEEENISQIFSEITDLKENSDNDHALTDPDMDDEETHEHPTYKLPPYTLLHKPTEAENKDYSRELQANGVKLVSALESFKVRTKITNISRGPTITRYELLPDQGVRVRAIANLVDDIALNLETSGVRIEAPIPGKPAVGIEVPNREPETVYLRELLENPKFSQASSKVTAALGMDVAGDPIFVDIAKMPHLLIAGTTGSGKSVCINSLLISLLYRSSPDDVKLILIDPKKVELGVYNKLPHLLVPVVTQPKKAAGALTWAVEQMEKRFDMIEQAGVRDIKGYNRLAEENPEMEKMPNIVIVIDELADLMLTTPDTVEESICRLAQKARAAGMHLIVGTQRPSVDVITGLIKANIPSRIAFTVVSNVDSRTIIDIAGAEKLIGRGDMLYSPVGSMKPIRVQGAFVSDTEVEAVCDFVRDNYGEAQYDQKTIDGIREHEAECEEGYKKKGTFNASGDSDEEADPKFMEAIRVAVSEGKVSTSLLQRKLGLGYGRAAKIIDRMEDMGIVTPPDGQKPRNVLMTMDDYQEMIMGQSDNQ